MSPSTKNLRERIEATIESVTCDCGEGPCEGHIDQLREAMYALLSSELSLAVKGLRESLAKVPADVHIDNPSGNFGFGKTRYNTTEKFLKAFDSKAKEILGESS